MNTEGLLTSALVFVPRVVVLLVGDMNFDRAMLLFLVVTLLGGRATAFYTSSDAVVTLEPTTFSEKIAGGIWLVEFFAPW